MQLLYGTLSKFYPFIIGPLVNTELEVELLDRIFHQHHVQSVLDIACGIGRHSIPLAKKGYSVTGLDYSPYQIKKAKEDAKKEHAKVRFILKDANCFSLPEKFDASICMWTTLGEEPLQYKKVIRNVFRVLKNGGIFVIDNRSWEYIPRKRKEIITPHVEAKGVVIKLRIYDRYTENFRVREVFYDINGKKYSNLCITHLLKEKAWISELKEGGFQHFEIYHNRKKKRVKRPIHITIVAIK